MTRASVYGDVEQGQLDARGMTSRSTYSARSDLIGSGLHAVRAVNAIKRLLKGDDLKERELLEVQLLEEALREASEVSNRKPASDSAALRPRNLVAVGLAIGALTPSVADTDAEEKVPDAFLRLADDIAALVRGGTIDESRLLKFGDDLIELVQAETGQPGETIRRQT